MAVEKNGKKTMNRKPKLRKRKKTSPKGKKVKRSER